MASWSDVFAFLLAGGEKVSGTLLVFCICTERFWGVVGYPLILFLILPALNTPIHLALVGRRHGWLVHIG